ncbi:HET-domain-containing protein [Apiospora arundinis]
MAYCMDVGMTAAARGKKGNPARLFEVSDSEDDANEYLSGIPSQELCAENGNVFAIPHMSACSKAIIKESV